VTAAGPVSDTWQVSFRYWGTAWPRECFAWIASASADTVHTAGSDEKQRSREHSSRRCVARQASVTEARKLTSGFTQTQNSRPLRIPRSRLLLEAETGSLGPPSARAKQGRGTRYLRSPLIATSETGRAVVRLAP
jgi:hypothetical protein